MNYLLTEDAKIPLSGTSEPHFILWAVPGFAFILRHYGLALYRIIGVSLAGARRRAPVTDFHPAAVVAPGAAQAFVPLIPNDLHHVLGPGPLRAH
jgi:hypothetical protein